MTSRYAMQQGPQDALVLAHLLEQVADELDRPRGDERDLDANELSEAVEYVAGLPSPATRAASLEAVRRLLSLPVATYHDADVYALVANQVMTLTTGLPTVGTAVLDGLEAMAADDLPGSPLRLGAVVARELGEGNARAYLTYGRFLEQQVAEQGRTGRGVVLQDALRTAEEVVESAGPRSALLRSAAELLLIAARASAKDRVEAVSALGTLVGVITPHGSEARDTVEMLVRVSQGSESPETAMFRLGDIAAMRAKRSVTTAGTVTSGTGAGNVTPFRRPATPTRIGDRPAQVGDKR